LASTSGFASALSFVPSASTGACPSAPVRAGAACSGARACFGDGACFAGTSAAAALPSHSPRMYLRSSSGVISRRGFRPGPGAWASRSALQVLGQPALLWRWSSSCTSSRLELALRVGNQSGCATMPFVVTHAMARLQRSQPSEPPSTMSWQLLSVILAVTASVTRPASFISALSAVVTAHGFGQFDLPVLLSMACTSWKRELRVNPGYQSGCLVKPVFMRYFTAS